MKQVTPGRTCLLQSTFPWQPQFPSVGSPINFHRASNCKEAQAKYRHTTSTEMESISVWSKILYIMALVAYHWILRDLLEDYIHIWVRALQAVIPVIVEMLVLATRPLYLINLTQRQSRGPRSERETAAVNLTKPFVVVERTESVVSWLLEWAGEYCTAYSLRG